MNHGCVFKAFLICLTFAGLSSQATTFPSVPGQYIVKLKNSAMLMNSKLVLGGTIERVVSNKNQLVLVQKSIIENADSAVATLAANPAVEYAEPNYIYRVSAGSTTLPVDPEFVNLWGLQNTGQTTRGDSGTIQGKAGMDIEAAKAWQVETGSKDIIVAVIDTGVDYNNPDLKDNIYTNMQELNGQPGVDDDGNGYVDDIHGYDFAKTDADPMDVFGHGSHCSGTIGASANNNTGIVGVAWNVTILPIRFLGDDGGGTLEAAIKSIEYATAMKANIMSNSWGGGGFSQALMDVIVQAKDAGILFIAAAGNNGSNNDSNPSYPASYNVDNVMSVAAMNPNGTLANFSNYGKTSVHVAAPGVNIVSHTMQGVKSWSGTSMATPHVSGIAALVMAHDRNMTYLDVKNRILQTARPMLALKGRISTGGLASAYNALTNTLPPLDQEDPANWKQDTQAISTAHPYDNSLKQDWVLSVPGATRIAIHFSRFETSGRYDVVEFRNSNGEVVGTLSGNKGEVYSPVISGDTVTITFATDERGNGYGFDIDKISYQ